MPVSDPPLFIDRPDLATAFAQQIAHAPILALDTEFHAEGRYLPKLMLLQVATPGAQIALIDPLASGVLDILAPALRACAWVLHGGALDIPILEHALGGLSDRIEDTQIMAGLVDVVYPASLQNLLWTHLNVHIDKGETLSDWSARPLSDAQRAYAAGDVAHLLALHHKLEGQLQALGRTEVAHLAHRAWIAQSRGLTPDPHAWRAFYHDAPDAQTAATAQALLQWRDDEARQAHLPPGFVVSDAVLRRIARTRPRDLQTLADDRRSPRSLPSRYGQALLDVVAQAEHAPPPTVVRRGSPADRRLLGLRAAACALSMELHASVDLLLPKPLAHALASAPPLTREALAQELGPFRDALLGSALFEALRGRISFCLTDDFEAIKANHS